MLRDLVASRMLVSLKGSLKLQGVEGFDQEGASTSICVLAHMDPGLCPPFRDAHFVPPLGSVS